MATIILKHSTVKDKLPSSAQFGEVFVNYNNENPFLATLNNQGQFEKFLSENKTKELFYTKSQVNDIIANIESGGTIEFDDYYKKNEVDTLLQSKSDISHTHSYTALTDLPDLSIYLTEHQSLENYYTKSEADGKFLTSHQDLSGYALKSELDDYLTIASASTIYATKEDLEEFTPTVDAYSKEETDALLAGKASSAHTHDYETLTNKPDLSNFATKGEIPDTNGFATKQELEDYQMKSGMTSYLTIAQAEQDLQPKGDYALASQIPDTSNFITSGFCEDRYQPKGTYVVPSDLNDYALKSEIPSIEGLATEAELANYMSLSGMSGYSEVNHTHDYSQIQNTPDLSGYASLSDVPKIWKGTLSEYTNLTEIDNDTLYVITDESEQFVTSGEVESMISGYTTLSEVEVLLGGYSTTSHTHSYNDLTDKPTIPSTTGLASEEWVSNNFSTTAHTHDYSEIQNTPDLSGFASLSDIPDVSNFITSGFCEDRYQPKGTYVVPSDLDDYALKTDLPTVPDSYTKTETDNLLAGKANSAHTHSYTALTDLPDLSIYLTEHQDISGLATKQELENYQMKSGMTSYLTVASAESTYQPKGTYVVPSDLNDYALKSELPSIEGLATEAELANYMSLSGMSEYSTTAHTHSYNDLTDKPTIPSTSGLASETWVTNNFAGTGHTHSQYLTQTSADSRYARVVSCTQAEYDALAQNDQVEQGVLYCITESN